MKILVAYGGGERLNLFARAIANALPISDSIQLLSLLDVTPREWQWADWLVLGVSCEVGAETAIAKKVESLARETGCKPKWFAIFQLQSRSEPPLSAAYGYALGRRLREMGMIWIAPPAVFFGKKKVGSELEGEMLRAQQWLVELVVIMDGTISQDR